MSNGFGKISQQRTDEEVVSDCKKTVAVLNEILEVLSQRGYRVDAEVTPIMYVAMPTRRVIEVNIYKEL